MRDELKNIVEAVLLVSESPLNVSRIQKLFELDAQPSTAEIERAIHSLQKECETRGVELRKIGTGYRYHSREKYAAWIHKLHSTRPPKMPRALLETLAIIAYRQPVTRGDIENIRGVTVATELMQRLLEREWIKEVGVRDVPGHPTLFATTPEFLSWFALESLKDLPPLLPQRGFSEIAGEMEAVLPNGMAIVQNAPQQDVFQAQDDKNAQIVDANGTAAESTTTTTAVEIPSETAAMETNK